MTLVAARVRASRRIRVCAIAPGVVDTPLADRLPLAVKGALAASIPHPARSGRPHEFATMAAAMLENPMLDGEAIRPVGAIRMAPR